MGLKVAADVTVTRRCIIRIPVDGMAHRDEIIHVKFRIIHNSEEDELWGKVFTPPLRKDFADEGDFREALQAHEANQRTYARQLLTQAIVGWDEKSGIEDASGNPLPFSPDNLKALLELPYAVAGLTKAYHEAVAGKGGAKGN